MDAPSGPGIQPSQGIDKPLLTGAIFAVIGWTPVSWWTAVLGVGYFGPIELPAVVAMVATLFGFIAVLRGVDLGDVRTRNLGGAVVAIGLLRLFFVPFL